MQESTKVPLSDKFKDVYTRFNDDLYSLGVSEINLVDPLATTLQLRATSHAIVKLMQNIHVNSLLRVLFDTGSDKTMLRHEAIPKGIVPSLGRKRKITGVNATTTTNREVMLEEMTLPEFSATQRVSGPIRAIVMSNMDGPYDLIIGMDMLQALGIDIHNTSKTIVWNNKRAPFKPRDYFESNQYQDALNLAMAGYDDDDEDDLQHQGYKSRHIKSSHYEPSDPNLVAEAQLHLTPSQRKDLASLLAKFPKLFSGVLGQYPGKTVHLDLKQDIKEARCRPYPVPKHHEQVFKEELARLCRIGVLSRCGASSWLSPSFIIPKKDASVRWISDFRELNKCIRRRVYHLPKIQDILVRRSGYEHFTKLDISMQYYTFKPDGSIYELCTMCTPFGNYRYN